MIKKFIPTFLAAAVLFAGASFTAMGCGESGYKTSKATENESGGMSSMAGNETSVGGASFAGGNETGVGLDAVIVQGTGTSEK